MRKRNLSNHSVVTSICFWSSINVLVRLLSFVLKKSETDAL